MGSSRSLHSTRAVKSRPAKSSSPSKSPDESQAALTERERTKLTRASALLACLHVATVHNFKINVADVGDVIEALDVANLKRAANAPDVDEEDKQVPAPLKAMNDGVSPLPTAKLHGPLLFKGEARRRLGHTFVRFGQIFRESAG